MNAPIKTTSTDAFMDGYCAARSDMKCGQLYSSINVNAAGWRDGYRRFLSEFDAIIASRRANDLRKCGFFWRDEINDVSLEGHRNVVAKLMETAKNLAHLAATDPFHPAYSLPYQRMIQRLCKQEMAAVEFLTGEAN